jgi:SAM-dependent methyltransferase
MQDDIRAAAAQYYDANPTIPDDIAFYTARLPSANASVLELGCGTGRVLLPLAAACGAIYGMDRSPAMLARCVQKLQAAGIPRTKAWAELGDITDFALGRQFDLIIAPYRVFQLLETAVQVEGVFRCVGAHLAPGGTCILNVFHPQGGFERVRQAWETAPEVCLWEATVDGVRLRCDERRARLDPAQRILYPELVYRHAVGDTWIEDAVLKIPRRCYAPEEFEAVIRAHGFWILQRWGGYAGERYGEGPELVVQFRRECDPCGAQDVRE